MSTKSDINVFKPISSISTGVNKSLVVNMITKYAVHIAIAVIVIIIIVSSYYIKERFITESVRSDSDANTNGWDLRESINKYLKAQQNLLSGRVNNI